MCLDRSRRAKLRLKNSWPLSYKIWALVYQQDRKKSLSKADSEVLREYSLQVCMINYRKYFVCMVGRDL